MKRRQTNTVTAGLDISKHWLDAALSDGDDTHRFGNNMAGFPGLVSWLVGHGVKRVGMESTGGYERDVRDALEAAGFEVIVHQPAEVKAYGRYKRVRAKSDKIDARLIAQATKNWEGIVRRRDATLNDLTELLSIYEHLADLLAQARAFAEHLRSTAARARHQATIEELRARKKAALAEVQACIQATAHLQARSDLLQSLPGIGQVVAAVMVIRMPELGCLDHGQAAALLGVAPFDRDSGELKGRRFIQGGRSRPRTFAYLAALAAKRMDTSFKRFADRLLSAGKPPKLVITAVARKLIEAANLVLKRQTPWIEQIN